MLISPAPLVSRSSSASSLRAQLAQIPPCLAAATERHVQPLSAPIPLRAHDLQGVSSSKQTPPLTQGLLLTSNTTLINKFHKRKS